jgi:pyrroloquinoline quinone biosynthesis protein B
MGHFTGLVHLGPEAFNVSQLPVLCSSRMGEFLSQNQPWSGLISGRNISLKLLGVEKIYPLSQNISVQPILVPHRDEASDTLAYVIRGPDRTLFYCPDIDSWAQWGQDIRSFFKPIDFALLDGTFYDSEEVPGRDLSQIPHPFVVDYPESFSGLDTEIFLIHLNHTNPLLDPGPERSWLNMRGIQVGYEGQVWAL